MRDRRESLERSRTFNKVKKGKEEERKERRGEEGRGEEWRGEEPYPSSGNIIQKQSLHTALIERCRRLWKEEELSRTYK